MAKSEWHYPRTDFAKQVYTLLAESPATAVSLFGPRRTGKTEFLKEDLAPLAEKKGHRVVYASLWQALDAPLATLLFAMDEALRGGKLTDRLATAARDLAPKLKLKPPGTGAEIEVDVAALKGKPESNHLLLLDQYCARLADEKKPTFLLFDEFQEIARTDASAALVAALRTSLDKRRRSLVSVFTGSSQDGLRTVFSARSAPFYRFATQLTLPILDEAFVDHQLALFKDRAKRTLARGDALKVFERVERNPLFFQQWLIQLMANKSVSPDAAITVIMEDLGQQFGFDATWKKLDGLQRAVCRILAESEDQPYSADAYAKLATLTGAAPPTTTRVQSSVRRLSRLGWIEKGEEAWHMIDPILVLWVRARPQDDFL